MEYKKFGKRVYIRLDKDDKIIEKILSVCTKERIKSAVFQGIGACGNATVATYIPQNDDFIDHNKTGMLELLSLLGNITTKDSGEYAYHAHAMFSYLNDNGEVAFFGGHLKDACVLYTAEITLDPVEDGYIGQKKDSCTGIDVWKF